VLAILVFLTPAWADPLVYRRRSPTCTARP